MNISINGYGENNATFITEGLVCPFHTVKMAGNLTVAPCAAGDEFIGMAINTNNECTCVQLDGYAEFSYSGTAPATGYCRLSADGNGGICADENGREHLVVNVNTTKSTAGIIL